MKSKDFQPPPAAIIISLIVSIINKDFAILLVFCQEHIQLEWLDDNHKFVKDVEVPLPGCEVKQYKKGEYSKILWSYVEERAKCLDKRVYDRLLVWGQPKAWVDSQICVQISNELAFVRGERGG